MDNEEKRVVCEGCMTGNPFLCISFPGKAPKHADREVQYRKRKAAELAKAGKRKNDE